VDEVEVDGEDGGRALVLGNDVVVPDLLDERAGLRMGHGGLAPGWRCDGKPKGTRGCPGNEDGRRNRHGRREDPAAGRDR
jgi:hypothetical protein